MGYGVITFGNAKILSLPDKSALMDLNKKDREVAAAWKYIFLH